MIQRLGLLCKQRVQFPWFLSPCHCRRYEVSMPCQMSPNVHAFRLGAIYGLFIASHASFVMPKHCTLHTHMKTWCHEGHDNWYTTEATLWLAIWICRYLHDTTGLLYWCADRMAQDPFSNEVDKGGWTGPTFQCLAFLCVCISILTWENNLAHT
jgi:hypothetical protein